MSAAALIAVVISWSMPTVHDYSMELKNIRYQLSRIADNLARIAERMGKTDDH
jgi:hypothetical protein